MDVAPLPTDEHARAVLNACDCHERHQARRIVLTGGPGAGKTAVLELARRSFCHHVNVLPEAASILFSGGFPRTKKLGDRRAAQRAIFYVQRELERAADEADGMAIVLCDRGTVDGAAYWPGPDEIWDEVPSNRQAELARYDVVLHLRTPPLTRYNHLNPLRLESATEATAIDDRIVRAWDGHPHRYFVDSTDDFLQKARVAMRILEEAVPSCCRHAQVAHPQPAGSLIAVP